MTVSKACKECFHEWCMNRDHDECNCTCKCHSPKTRKWFMAVARYQRNRYGGDARPCSALYPTKAALLRHCDIAGWDIVIVELPKSVPENKS